jgi:hypothetical protein
MENKSTAQRGKTSSSIYLSKVQHKYLPQEREIKARQDMTTYNEMQTRSKLIED